MLAVLLPVFDKTEFNLKVICTAALHLALQQYLLSIDVNVYDKDTRASFFNALDNLGRVPPASYSTGVSHAPNLLRVLISVALRILDGLKTRTDQLEERVALSSVRHLSAVQRRLVMEHDALATTIERLEEDQVHLSKDSVVSKKVDERCKSLEASRSRLEQRREELERSRS